MGKYAKYEYIPDFAAEFLYYCKTIKNMSDKTVDEYYLDLRVFFRFIDAPFQQDWFIDEQAEEEKSARDLIAKVEQFASDARGGLYLLELGLALGLCRYTAPVQA